MKKFLYAFFLAAFVNILIISPNVDASTNVESIDAVSSATAVTQFKEDYIVGESLDYQVFTIQLNYADGTNEVVSYPDFKSKGISINPSHGTELKEVGDFEIVFEKDGVKGSKIVKVTRKQFTLEVSEYAKGENVIFYAANGDYWYPLESDSFGMTLFNSKEELNNGTGKLLKRKEDYNLATALQATGDIVLLNKTIGNEGEYFLELNSNSYETKTFKIAVNSEGSIKVEEIKSISFETNGGTTVESSIVVKGEKAVKPQDPTKEGFNFAGWSLDEAGTKLFDFETVVTEDIKLFAIWEEVKAPTVQKSITLIGGTGTLKKSIDEQLNKFNLSRIAGANRYDTAVSISEQYSQSDVVLLATGRDYADALTATVLAHKLNAPMLLTPTDSMPKSVENEIIRLKAKKVIIIGGEEAVSKKNWKSVNR